MRRPLSVLLEAPLVEASVPARVTGRVRVGAKGTVDHVRMASREIAANKGADNERFIVKVNHSANSFASAEARQRTRIIANRAVVIAVFVFLCRDMLGTFLKQMLLN